MNILIVKLSAIGDVIHTLPALNAIRKQFPEARLTWLVEEDASDFVKGHKALDRVIVSKRKRWIRGFRGPGRLKHIREAYRFVKELRDTRYDLIITFQSLFKSGILVKLARGKRKIGFGKGMDHMEKSYLFLNEPVPAVDMNIHALKRGLILLESVGIPSDEVVYDLPIRKSDRDAVDALLLQYGVEGSKPLVAINPMAKWKTKLWSNRKFARLADRLMERYDVQLVFTGSRGDREVVQDIMSGMQGKAANLAGETTLTMLPALYERTRLLVTTDTGPMHVAAAVATPVVALFGPTAPWRTGPFGSGHQVIRAAIECSPCFQRRCRTIDCMKRISVENVLDGVRKLEIL